MMDYYDAYPRDNSNGDFYEKSVRLYQSELKDIAERYSKGQATSYIAKSFKISTRECHYIIRLLDREVNGALYAKRKKVVELANKEKEALKKKDKGAVIEARKEIVEKLREKIPPPIQAHPKGTHFERIYEHKYRNPQETFKKSLEVEVQGEDTLFCDTEFLEQFMRKPVKKSEDCK